MEVRPRAKQTEVGVIPKDWDVVRIGHKTTKVGSGITPTGGARVYRREGRPFIRSQNVGWGQLLLEDVAFIDEATHDAFKATTIQCDDILLNITGASIGRSAVADSRIEGGNVNQHVCIIRTVQDQLFPRFLNYYLISQAGQRQINSFQAGGNRQGLNFGQIRSFLLPLPPTKAEQEAIAQALSDADAFIESLEELLAKKRDLKQGAMQELLTGKRRLPGFEVKAGSRPTEAGLIAEDWSVATLGEHAILKTGPFGSALHQSDYFYGGVPIVNPMQIIDGTIRPTPSMAVTELAALKLAAFRLSAGDIVIGRRGDMGRCALVLLQHEGWLCGTGSMIIRLGPSLDAHYVQRVLSSSPIIAKIETASIGSTMSNLNQSMLRDLKIPLPPTKEQETIAEVLRDMEADCAVLKEELGKARSLKQGMMQELMSGRTRLV